MLEIIRRHPIIISVIVFNLLIAIFLSVIHPQLAYHWRNFLAIGPYSLNYPWQLWSFNFTHQDWPHVIMNMLFTFQFGVVVLAHYRKRVQFSVLFVLPLLLGLIMLVPLQFFESRVIGYSGMAMALFGFYLAQKRPQRQNYLIQVLVFHVIVWLLGLPISFVGHGTGLLVGFIVAVILESRPDLFYRR